VLTRLRELATPPHTRLRRDLRAAYLETLRIARQLRAHAEQVPYAALVGELQTLADRSDRQAATLAAALRAAGGDTDRHAGEAVHGGRNHWARLSADLHDLQALHRRTTELALRYDADAPETADRLSDVARTAAGMERVVRALIARADPHAAN